MIKALVNKEIMYAVDAKSGLVGECPHCGKLVRARCGEINVEHWAHIEDECPYITEIDTEWHVAWKNKFKKKEYIIEKRFDNFIADAYDPKTNIIVEFQHSSITPQEIVDKCNYYRSINKNIKWIFDYTDKYKRQHIILTEIVKNDNSGFYYKFKINWQKKSYIKGISNEIDGLKIPVYFNIIYNYDIKNHVQLRVTKNIEEYKNDMYNNSRYRRYLEIYNYSMNFDNVLAELDYDVNTAVLVKPEKVHENGKYGWGYLTFI